MQEYKVRTQEDWIEEARKALPKCKWFIVKYFKEKKYNELFELLEKKQILKLLDELNAIWYDLPDDKFNIMKNPEGWSDFLNLLEFYNEEEIRNVLKS